MAPITEAIIAPSRFSVVLTCFLGVEGGPVGYESDMSKVHLPKGTRDLLPQQMNNRLQVIQTVRQVFERFGFEPLETPAFEITAEEAKTGRAAGWERTWTKP